MVTVKLRVTREDGAHVLIECEASRIRDSLLHEQIRRGSICVGLSIVVEHDDKDTAESRAFSNPRTPDTTICPMSIIEFAPHVLESFDWTRQVAVPLFFSSVHMLLSRDALFNTNTDSNICDTENVEGVYRPYTAIPSDKLGGARALRPLRSEGHGRPLSAAASNRLVGARLLRPGKIEGHGRPYSAAASDRFVGARMYRPSRIEGHGRPTSAAASDHRFVGVDKTRPLAPRSALGSEEEEMETDKELVEEEEEEEDTFLNASRPPTVIVSSNRKVIDVTPLYRIGDYFSNRDDPPKSSESLAAEKSGDGEDEAEMEKRTAALDDDCGVSLLMASFAMALDSPPTIPEAEGPVGDKSPLDDTAIQFPIYLSN